MGDIIRRKLVKYDMVSIILTIFLLADIFTIVCIEHGHGDVENTVRVEMNPYLVALNEELSLETLQSLQTIPYPVSVFDTNGKVLYSTREEYPVGKMVDLSILGGTNQYLVPIVHNKVSVGIMSADITSFTNKNRYRQILLEMIAPVILIVLLLMQIMKRRQLIEKDIWEPVTQIHRATRGILKGNYEEAVEYDYSGEIGQLCHDFENMRDEIRNGKQRENQSQEKERVLYASISHDLKTPLSIIHGYLEQMIYGVIKEPEEIRETLKLILSKTNVINHLINDIMEHSKAQMNQLSIHKQELYADEFFGELLAEYQEESQRMDYLLTYNLPPKLQMEIDPDRISQVIQNIIGNAIKYGRKPEDRKSDLKIAVRFSVIKTDSGRILVTEIKDNGAGIDAADMPFVFDLFYRGNKARTQDIPGSGMGLNISKYIIEQHGGRIECDSVAKAGTAISFSLPIL